MTISTPRDANRITMAIGTLDSDGATPVAITVTASLHAVRTSSGATGSTFASGSAARDANRVPTLWGVSSADGTTPIYIAVDSNGKILTKKT